jgi:hypothetical protein
MVICVVAAVVLAVRITIRINWNRFGVPPIPNHPTFHKRIETAVDDKSAAWKQNDEDEGDSAAVAVEMTVERDAVFGADVVELAGNMERPVAVAVVVAAAAADDEDDIAAVVVVGAVVVAISSTSV